MVSILSPGNPCSQPASLQTNNGYWCPTLAAFLFLPLGWGAHHYFFAPFAASIA